MRAFATSILHHFAAALRALFFMRVPREVPADGFAPVVAMSALAIAATAAAQRWLAGTGATFEPNGIGAAIGGVALFAALVQCLRRQSRPFNVASLIATSIAVSMVTLACMAGAFALPQSGYWTFAVFWIVFVWGNVAYWRLGRAVTVDMPRRLGPALPLVALLPLVLLPSQPMFSGDNDSKFPTI